MPSRYKKSKVKVNKSALYKGLRERRGLPHAIVQYETSRRQPVDVDDGGTLNNVLHIWKTGDRFYKLAATHYSDPKLWWIIAWYNNKPTEAHASVGDAIYVPLPLERVYGLMGA